MEQKQNSPAEPNFSSIEIAQDFGRDFALLCDEINKVIVGYRDIVEHVVIGLFANGHVLLEGVPGLGKTMLVRTMSHVLDLPFSRVQFTPDLMPADILGTTIINIDDSGRRAFQFQPGPIFTNLLLADEINRATPKTQSALLEAMQEKSVTTGNSTRKLDLPFFVMATQNPLEMEGTYPLPEAQLDRFMFKLLVPFPNLDNLTTIMQRTTQKSLPELRKILSREKILNYMNFIPEVYIQPAIYEYVAKLVLATHPKSELATPLVTEYVQYGSSPRGAQSLIWSAKIKALAAGRYNASFEDVKSSAYPALRHRIMLNIKGASREMNTDQIITEILAKIPVFQNINQI